jgi:hypothetical protein
MTALAPRAETIVWPATLPQVPLSATYEEQGPECAIRTPMEFGPAKIRRRYSIGISEITAEIICTHEQVQTLDTFYWETHRAGEIPFEWIHYLTGNTERFRLREPPRYEAVENQELWRVRLSLEMLPAGMTLLAPFPGPPVAITAINLATAADAADATVYTTASIAPALYDLVLAWVNTSKTGGGQIPALTGNGLSWVQVATVLWNTVAAPTDRLTLFRASGQATPGAVTITLPSTHTGCAWSITQYANADLVLQSATHAIDAGAASWATVLGAAPDAANVTAAGNVIDTSANLLPASGWTELGQATA